MKAVIVFLPVLFAASLTAAEPVVVHEWGVIVDSGTSAILQSEPSETFTETFWEMDEKAPVIYFHGAPVPGDFIVRIPDGTVTACYPSPDQGGEGYNHAVWSNLRLEETSTFDGLQTFSQPADAAIWRNVDALGINRDSDGFSDRFLFYESTVGNPSILPLTSPLGTPAVRMDYADVEVLLIRADDPGMQMCTMRELTDMESEGWVDPDPDRAAAILQTWSEGVINEDEFTAFWNTWGNWFMIDALDPTEERIALAVYMVPEEMANRISLIHFEPYVDLQVDYSRYLICAVTIRL